MTGPQETKLDCEATEDAWREAFERAWKHVPLSLYDEHRKPAERAFGEMLTALHGRALSQAGLGGVDVFCRCCAARHTLMEHT